MTNARTYALSRPVRTDKLAGSVPNIPVPCIPLSSVVRESVYVKDTIQASHITTRLVNLFIVLGIVPASMWLSETPRAVSVVRLPTLSGIVPDRLFTDSALRMHMSGVGKSVVTRGTHRVVNTPFPLHITAQAGSIGWFQNEQ